MARYSIIMVTLHLLILNATQGYSAELDFTKSAFLSTMKGVKYAMECFSSDAHENRASLNSLTEMVLQLKNQISQLNRNNEVMKKESTDLQRIEKITKENQDLKTMLEAKDTTVATLIREVEDLKQKLETKDKTVDQLTEANDEMNLKLTRCEKQGTQLTEDKAELKIKLDDCGNQIHDIKQDADAKTKTIEDCSQKVQDLDKRLQESLQRTQELEASVQELNQTVEAQKNETDQSGECNQPQLQAVKTVVQQFKSNKDVNLLRSDLLAAMDPGSEVYRQLQSISDARFFMYYLGYGGHIELATLLLCADLNVETTDSKNYNMLHGAAIAGNVQLVKFLLDHGATVDVPGVKQYTALMWAAYHDHLDVAKLLVEAGASTTAKDYLGNTPLQIAEKYGTTAVAVYLQQFPH